MQLKQLLAATTAQLEKIEGDTHVEITGVAYDSRKVKPGNLFVCVHGYKVDGHTFIPQAIANGAKAIVVTKPEVTLPQGVTKIVVRDSREALGLLAAAFYGNPAQALTIIGVTGTNGKTTTTYLIKAILEAAGYRVGLLGTIQNLIGDQPLPAAKTTPESLDLHALFAQMRDAGVTHVVMEVSSHALALKRITGIPFAVGVFTNITQDHLDFHASFEEYLAVKTAFFTEYARTCVLNVDDPHTQRIIEAVQVAGKKAILTYSMHSGASDFHAEGVELRPQGVRYHAQTPAGLIPLTLQLTGHFNVANSLASIGAALALGIERQAIRTGLESVPGVPGRLERVDLGQDFTVLVDYAHTPDGLANLLEAAKQLPGSRRVVVFGCGGDRDRGKRPQMGAIAAKLADFVYLTTDNPRSEDPVAIIQEIEAGVQAAASQTPYEVIVDRAEAIRTAIRRALPGDIILIAGKGHENYQIIGEQTIPFDDREVARACLKERN